MAHVTVGFVAPVTEAAQDRPLTLDAFLRGPAPGRFYMTVESRADVPVALGSGDLLVVDTTRPGRPGSLVIVEDGESFACAQLTGAEAGLRVFGVVTHVLVAVR